MLSGVDADLWKGKGSSTIENITPFEEVSSLFGGIAKESLALSCYKLMQQSILRYTVSN